MTKPDMQSNKEDVALNVGGLIGLLAGLVVSGVVLCWLLGFLADNDLGKPTGKGGGLLMLVLAFPPLFLMFAANRVWNWLFKT